MMTVPPAPDSAASVGAADEKTKAKIRTAGVQFEAVLLNRVLGDLERAFTDLPGKKQDHAADAYNGFAMQALASNLAQCGGIGLGKMVSNALAQPAAARQEAKLHTSSER